MSRRKPAPDLIGVDTGSPTRTCAKNEEATMTETHPPNEMMTIRAPRGPRNTDVCFVGIGAPSAACNLARLTHAPDIPLIYESGTIATTPSVLPLSIGAG